MSDYYSQSSFSRFGFGRSGFTLIEVLIAFAIMSVLLTAIIQSQSDSAFILSSTDVRIKIRSHIQAKLFEIERTADNYTEGITDGVFEQGDDLAGSRWVIGVTVTSVFQVPLKKITYSVFWNEDGIEKSLSAYVLAKAL